jgi:aminopeptidase N
MAPSESAPVFLALLAWPSTLLAGPDVTHYKLDLTLDPATLELSATAGVTITGVKGGGAVPTIDLELTGYSVSSVTWNGAPAAYGRSGDALTVTLPDHPPRLTSPPRLIH